MFGWVLSLLFIWSAVDIGMSMMGMPALSLPLETEYIKERGYTLKRGYQGTTFSISPEGLRKDGVLPSVLDGEKRILFLGDSTCFSSYTIQGLDWPTVVEKELRASGVPATTLNGGVPGYFMINVNSAYPWFKNRMPVDMVVIYVGWNDFILLSQFDPNFNFDLSVKKLFPQYPSSFKPGNDFEKYDIPPESPPDALFALIKPLRYLITSSPLASHIYAKLSTGGWLKGKYDVKRPFSSAENYMFYLGLLIEQAQKDGVPVIILQSFSVFKSKLFNFQRKEKYLRATGFEPGKGKIIIPQLIRQMDTINNRFADDTSIMVIDATPEMLEKIPPEGINEWGYETYMGSPFHTGPKGSLLLGSIVANKLIKVGLVEQTEKAPWVHPLEKTKEDYDLRYRRFSLKNFEFNRVLLGFLFAITFSLIGGLFLLLLSDFKQFNNYFGWLISLGAVTTLISLFLLHQFINNPLWCLIITLIFLILIPVVVILKKQILAGGRIKKFLLKVVISGLVGSVLIFCASEIVIYIHKNSESALKVIQDYLAWMDFQVRHSIFEKGELTYDNLYQKARADGSLYMQDAIVRPLKFLYHLIQKPHFYSLASPLLASAVSMAIGVDPLDVFLTLFGLAAAALTMPAALLYINRISILRTLRAKPLEYCFSSLLIVFLCAASFSVGMFILVPATQNSAIGIAGMALAIYFEGTIYKRSLIFLLSAGLTILTPDPPILLLMTGMALLWGITNSATNNSVGSKKITLWVSGGVGLIIFGKILMLAYPAAHPAVFEFLEAKLLVLPFNLKTLDSVAITYHFLNGLNSISITYYLFALIIIGFVGYILARDFALKFAALIMLVIAAAFFCHQELFKPIPLIASLTVVVAILSSSYSVKQNL